MKKEGQLYLSVCLISVSEYNREILGYAVVPLVKAEKIKNLSPTKMY